MTNSLWILGWHTHWIMSYLVVYAYDKIKHLNALTYLKCLENWKLYIYSNSCYNYKFLYMYWFPWIAFFLFFLSQVQFLLNELFYFYILSLSSPVLLFQQFLDLWSVWVCIFLFCRFYMVTFSFRVIHPSLNFKIWQQYFSLSNAD